MHYWLVKTEPTVYSWEDLVSDKTTFWSGVRNYGARNNLRAMTKGDLVLFYYSMTDAKAIVGITKIVRAAYQDPTTTNPAWVCVDLKPHKLLKHPLALTIIKKTPLLSHMQLVTHSRLSVQKVTPAEFKIILQLSK